LIREIDIKRNQAAIKDNEKAIHSENGGKRTGNYFSRKTKNAGMFVE